MGCFLGCFGGSDENKHRKQRIDRPDLRSQRNRVQNVAQRKPEVKVQRESTTAEPSAVPNISNKLTPELTKPDVVEQLSPSPRKRVTFNDSVTTYEHSPERESVASLQEFITEEEKKYVKTSQSHLLKNEVPIASTVRPYPPNHRYHNIRDSDDEAEYGDSDLDDLEDDLKDCDEDEDTGISSHGVWSESVSNAVESRTGVIEESPVMKTKTGDRIDMCKSVLSPVENVAQWKAAKLKETHLLKPQKENLVSNFEATRTSISSEGMPPMGHSPFISKKVGDPFKRRNQEISVDASLSTWLSSPEVTTTKKTSLSGSDTVSSGGTASDGHSSVRAFEDRPILGALTLEELKQFSVSPTLKKSPSRSPEEIPIIGTVGTYWSDSGSSSTTSFKGIPNTTSKYKEDKRVKWHSTPFETRLDRVLGRGAAEP